MCAQRYFHFIYQEIVGTVKRRFDWQIHSFFVCCGDFLIWGNFVSIGKNQIFFLALFFSLFRCCFLAIYCKIFFFARKKAKFPLRCHTLSFLIFFEKKFIWFFLSISWLDWGHSTASNQLQIFLKIFFSMRTKEVLLWPFFIWPFSVWVQTHTEYGIKVLIFFCTIFENQKFLKEFFDHEICLTLFQQPEKRLIFFNRSLHWNIAKKVD